MHRTGNNTGCFCRKNAKILLKKKAVTTLQGLHVQLLLCSKWQKATLVAKSLYFIQITTSTMTAEVRQEHLTVG